MAVHSHVTSRFTLVVLVGLVLSLSQARSEPLKQKKSAKQSDASLLSLQADIQNALEKSEIEKLLHHYSQVNEIWQTAVDEGRSFDVFRKYTAREFASLYQRISTSSKIRSSLIQHFRQEDVSVFVNTPHYFNDLLREVISIPMKFTGASVYKYLQYQKNIDSGFSGIYKAIKEMGLFFLVIFFIPFFARWSNKTVHNYLDSLREDYIRSARSGVKSSYNYALWIRRLTPYTSYAVFYFALALSEGFLQSTSLQSLMVVIPILKYFVLYQVFRQLTRDLFDVLRRYSYDKKDGDRSHLIVSTARFIGLFFFFAYTILYLAEASVGVGLLHYHVSRVMIILAVICLFWVVYRWRDFMVPAANSILPSKLSGYLTPRTRGVLAPFYSLILFLILIVYIVRDLVWDFLSNWEPSKVFIAKFYRKKIESFNEKKPQQKSYSMPLPDDYLSMFNLEYSEQMEEFIDVHEDAFKEVHSEISEWVLDSDSDQSVAIYGEKGMGKSTLMRRLAADFEAEGVSVRTLKVESKICQKDGLRDFLAKSLEVTNDASCLKLMLQYDQSLEKKEIIFIDNAHNLFLGEVGGLEALKTFIDVVNLKTEKIFWCLTFNEYPWSFLKGLMGSSQYLRTEVHIKPWTDTAIQRLVRSRHDLSGYKLSYDQIIMATKTKNSYQESLAFTEEQFFRILWEQSHGNPRVALHLWTKCLRYNGGKRLKVGLPERPNFQRLIGMEDDFWFVLASLVKHENLTRKELISTTNIPWARVAQAIKIGLERKLLFKSKSNRYRLHFLSQSELVKQLKVKNFIYGTD